LAQIERVLCLQLLCGLLKFGFQFSEAAANAAQLAASEASAAAASARAGDFECLHCLS
jgi:hypothetical protein